MSILCLAAFPARLFTSLVALMRGRVVRPVLAALLVTAFAAAAPAQQQLVAGRDYNVINPPQATDSPGKIEVIEFFWYGCPHCYGLEPSIEKWIKTLPADVVFRRVPAMFNENWAVAARHFYTFEAMNLMDRLHKPFFDAIHKENLRVTSESAMTDWLKKMGVDTDAYMKASRSFTVESRLRRATQMTEAYKFDGVPALAVQGRYIALAAQARAPETLIRNADALIAMARKELAAGTPAAKK